MRATAKQVVTITQTNDSASLHGEHSPRRPGCDQPSAQYEHLQDTLRGEHSQPRCQSNVRVAEALTAGPPSPWPGRTA
jgi:hypothetical protein